MGGPGLVRVGVWGVFPRGEVPIFFTDHGTSLVNAGGACLPTGPGWLLSVQVPFAVNASASASSKMVRRVDVDRPQAPRPNDE